MKKHITLILLCQLLTFTTNAQIKSFVGGQYGHVLNIGIGNSYYNYIGHTVPVLHANYEFQVVRNITLAPFITFYRYSNSQYWGNSQNSYKSYYYHQTVIPIGVKGSYYFDELLNAGTNWDFYLAGSLGFAFRTTSWEDGFLGQRTISNGTSGLYLDGHIGFEYHLTQKIGASIDLSTGISTLGLAIHL